MMLIILLALPCAYPRLVEFRLIRNCERTPFSLSSHVSHELWGVSPGECTRFGSASSVSLGSHRRTQDDSNFNPTFTNFIWMAADSERARHSAS
jgi:hypothetical protein